MKKIKEKLLLFLVVAIVMTSASFLIVGCGTSPTPKVVDSNKGQYALDFNATDCPNPSCIAVISSSSFTLDKYKIAGKELTIEAWVMPKSTSTPGDVFTHLNAAGAKMFLAGNGTTTHVVPKFQISRLLDISGVTSTVSYVVSGAPILLDTWSHVAGVLANANHSSVAGHPTCSGAEALEPHMDFIVDGDISACATSRGAVNDDEAPVGFAHNSTEGSVGMGINGIIDEVRFWTTDRTAEISSATHCRNQELDNTSGACGRDNDNLITYIRFNEGVGSSINDAAGLGAGAGEYPDPDNVGEFLHWETGWVAQPTILIPAD